MVADRKLVTAVTATALILLAAYTWIFHDVFTSQVPGANDFFSRWAGAHLYITRGWDPYGEQTGLWIQEAIWGHPARPNQDPSLFAYPFYTIFIIAPYALIADYSWAQAAWQVTLQVVVVATLLLLLRYFRWRPAPLLLGWLVLWMVAFYPTARSLILGQIGVVVFGMTVVAAWLLFRTGPGSPSGDAWAGALLAITTVKPQMQFLVIPFFLLWALRERRWWVIVTFAAVATVLVGASFLLLPQWLTEWIAQVVNYPSYTPPAVLYIVTHEIIPFGSAADVVERILDVVLLLYLAFEWWLVLWRREDARMDWTLGLTLVITHLVVLRTATTHFIVFVFVLIPTFRGWVRSGTRGLWGTVGLMIVLVVGMWWLFLATLVGKQESDLVHVPLPLLMLVLLLATRGWRSPARQEQSLA